MKETFDFNKIGKRMPYKTPQGFFSDMESRVWAEVSKDAKGKADRPRVIPMKTRLLSWRTFGAAAIAASVALLLVFNIPPRDAAESNATLSLDKAFAALSHEDQSCLLNIYQYDVFIDDDDDDDDNNDYTSTEY